MEERNLKICAVTATKGRHTLLERSMSFFLNQSYKDSKQIIFNNSEVPISLDTKIEQGRIILVNQHLCDETKLPYTNLGDIYTDALKYVPEDTDVVCFWDDDDIFMPRHIEEGIKGLIKGKKTAYKPLKSYFKSGAVFSLMNNTLEPSIFVKLDHIKKYGFSKETTAQHLQWVNPLVQQNEIFADPEGIPTLVYNWGTDVPCFKTSGDPNNPENFNNYTKKSQDHGDKIVSPVDVNKYYIVK